MFKIKCTACDGAKWIHDAEYEHPCVPCDGNGYILRPRDTPTSAEKGKCPNCGYDPLPTDVLECPECLTDEFRSEAEEYAHAHRSCVLCSGRGFVIRSNAQNRHWRSLCCGCNGTGCQQQKYKVLRDLRVQRIIRSGYDCYFTACSTAARKEISALDVEFDTHEKATNGSAMLPKQFGTVFEKAGEYALGVLLFIVIVVVILSWLKK